ncbi:hypothetical protein DS843_30335 [Roseomonas genomospecies 6]|uniref:Uncharacterized protein n=1 Tax=Roseomonas genomospecies 6 TaxID=214106 RepID=A0A9W7KNN1_9PROT|nr:hypothetical protein DS843_30335 [Roseomonas genomospecies 6]
MVCVVEIWSFRFSLVFENIDKSAFDNFEKIDCVPLLLFCVSVQDVIPETCRNGAIQFPFGNRSRRFADATATFRNFLSG